MAVRRSSRMKLVSSLELVLVLGLYACAVAFSLLNAAVLGIRIRAEERALQLAAASPL